MAKDPGYKVIRGNIFETLVGQYVINNEVIRETKGLKTGSIITLNFPVRLRDKDVNIVYTLELVDLIDSDTNTFRVWKRIK